MRSISSFQYEQYFEWIAVQQHSRSPWPNQALILCCVLDLSDQWIHFMCPHANIIRLYGSHNCTLSLPLVSVLRGTNKFLNQRQGLILKVVKSQQRLSLMGLGGNIGTWEWGLFALEITHYLPPRSPPSPIRKYNALYLQKYLLSNTWAGKDIFPQKDLWHIEKSSPYGEFEWLQW